VEFTIKGAVREINCLSIPRYYGTTPGDPEVVLKNKNVSPPVNSPGAPSGTVQFEFGVHRRIQQA
jgi:hypothetical protein